MANWKEVLHELAAEGTPQALDNIRRKYLATIPLHNGGRNVIAYRTFLTEVL